MTARASHAGGGRGRSCGRPRCPPVRSVSVRRFRPVIVARWRSSCSSRAAGADAAKKRRQIKRQLTAFRSCNGLTRVRSAPRPHARPRGAAAAPRRVRRRSAASRRAPMPVASRDQAGGRPRAGPRRGPRPRWPAPTSRRRTCRRRASTSPTPSRPTAGGCTWRWTASCACSTSRATRPGSSARCRSRATATSCCCTATGCSCSAAPASATSSRCPRRRRSPTGRSARPRRRASSRPSRARRCSRSTPTSCRSSAGSSCPAASSAARLRGSRARVAISTPTGFASPDEPRVPPLDAGDGA